jgi:hypothetical protein
MIIWVVRKSFIQTEMWRNAYMDIIFLRDNLPVTLTFESSREEWFDFELNLVEFGKSI